MEHIFSFEKLLVWQESRELVKDVYGLLKNFPREENYSLCDQIRKSVISVSSNIAEGTGRLSPKEKIRFVEIAFGSLMECYCQFLLAYDLGYINDVEIGRIKNKIKIISKLLSGLRNKYQNKADISPEPIFKP